MKILQIMAMIFACGSVAHAQVSSGSNGSDGAFNPTTNIVINMADHPTGIYHYTSVNIPNTVIVEFIPNANNTPVVWLVQSNCVINGIVDVSGRSGNVAIGGAGGPGGWAGGSGGSIPGGGQGPGGGMAGGYAASASYGSLGAIQNSTSTQGSPPGSLYGNTFLIPLLGGSSGGGTLICATPDYGASGGGGGGGALLIAASNQIQLAGIIYAKGGSGHYSGYYNCDLAGGAGSGGGVRLVSQRLAGGGTIDASGGSAAGVGLRGGLGRVRLDTFENNFSGIISGVFSHGFQPIIIPTAGQGAQLTVISVGGVPVSASPTGQLSTPDAFLSSQQNNPIFVTVHCSNISLGTQITVSVKSLYGTTVSATGLNNTGTLASSTATISINMPRGGGIIYATASN